MHAEGRHTRFFFPPCLIILAHYVCVYIYIYLYLYTCIYILEKSAKCTLYIDIFLCGCAENTVARAHTRTPERHTHTPIDR